MNNRFTCWSGHYLAKRPVARNHPIPVVQRHDAAHGKSEYRLDRPSQATIKQDEHIDIEVHYLHHCIAAKSIIMTQVPSNSNTADILTKSKSTSFTRKLEAELISPPLNWSDALKHLELSWHFQTCHVSAHLPPSKTVRFVIASQKQHVKSYNTKRREHRSRPIGSRSAQ